MTNILGWIFDYHNQNLLNLMSIWNFVSIITIPILHQGLENSKTKIDTKENSSEFITKYSIPTAKLILIRLVLWLDNIVNQILCIIALP